MGHDFEENIQTPNTIAISTSESPDMALFGQSDEHLKEAMAEIAMYLLATGANLAYGGDLRRNGFTDLLFELSLRYRRTDRNDETRVIDYLAWPVHIRMTAAKLNAIDAELGGTSQLALIGIDGMRLSLVERRELPTHEPDDHEWSAGLTAMRQLMCAETDARILLGGRVEGYKGCMPGIAEEACYHCRSAKRRFCSAVLVAVRGISRKPLGLSMLGSVPGRLGRDAGDSSAMLPTNCGTGSPLKKTKHSHAHLTSIRP